MQPLAPQEAAPDQAAGWQQGKAPWSAAGSGRPGLLSIVAVTLNIALPSSSNCIDQSVMSGLELSSFSLEDRKLLKSRKEGCQPTCLALSMQSLLTADMVPRLPWPEIPEPTTKSYCLESCSGPDHLSEYAEASTRRARALYSYQALLQASDLVFRYEVITMTSDEFERASVRGKPDFTEIRALPC